MMTALKNEGINFSEVLIDKSVPADNAPTRKPKTGMLSAYLDNADYDLGSSYVIGDRLTDMELAANLGAKGILLQNDARMATAIPEALANWHVTEA
jgi:imidazoleglycerol-phosphate dehydratase/histidinol-phosphatase